MNKIIDLVKGETRLLRALDVANILNVSRAFAYRLMQQGKIRTVTFARTRRVRPSDLTEFLEANLIPDSRKEYGFQNAK